MRFTECYLLRYSCSLFCNAHKICGAHMALKGKKVSYYINGWGRQEMIDEVCFLLSGNGWRMPGKQGSGRQYVFLLYFLIRLFILNQNTILLRHITSQIGYFPFLLPLPTHTHKKRPDEKESLCMVNCSAKAFEVYILLVFCRCNASPN